MTKGMEGERQRKDGPPCIYMYMYTKITMTLPGKPRTCVLGPLTFPSIS